MAVVHFVVDSPIIWQIWYAHLIPAYIVLVFFARSRLSEWLFGSGFVFILPVAYVTAFAVVGGISSFAGSDFFLDLLSTSGDFGHIQVAAAFAVTATSADLAFASLVFRKYPDLSLWVKLVIAFWLLMIGWLLGVVIYLALGRYAGRSDLSSTTGPGFSAPRDQESCRGWRRRRVRGGVGR